MNIVQGLAVAASLIECHTVLVQSRKGFRQVGGAVRNVVDRAGPRRCEAVLPLLAADGTKLSFFEK